MHSASAFDTVSRRYPQERNHANLDGALRLHNNNNNNNNCC
jgi:hypothetical protein